MKIINTFLIVLLFFSSCKREEKKLLTKNPKTNKIVVISVNAPKNFMHFIKQDSVGKILNDTLGPKSYLKNNGFTYVDYMNNLQTWQPKSNKIDTLIIETYNDYVELSTHNFFTAIKETFLVKNGDTVIFNYQHQIPKATLKNRIVNDVELNYNQYRLKKLFNNKYSSHFLVFGNIFFNENINDFEGKTIEYYEKAKQDYSKEMMLLDSLKNNNQITITNYQYRVDALNMLMQKHQQNKIIKNWITQNSLAKENVIDAFGFDVTKTDSLFQFSFFRDYLNYNSTYGLELISENNGNSGGFYIDSRVRFDSIVKDKRFNETAKNHLLFETYKGINENFLLKDKIKYFKKLQENTTNPFVLKKLENDLKLDFKKSNRLILTSQNNDTLTFSQLIKNNKGKWLYIDFWASWCAPCKKLMPISNQLKKELAPKNIEFIYLALNDSKTNWEKSNKKYLLTNAESYFIENGNTSKVLEELHIKTIPHYLIYNPKGELVNGYAKRPNEGAKKQLLELVSRKIK